MDKGFVEFHIDVDTGDIGALSIGVDCDPE